MSSVLPPKLCERCGIKNTRLSLRLSKRLKYCDDCIVKDRKLGFCDGKAQKIRCIQCKEKKLYVEFSIDQHHNTRRQRRCKSCAAIYFAEWWAKNKHKEHGTSKGNVGSRLHQIRDKIRIELGDIR